MSGLKRPLIPRLEVILVNVLFKGERADLRFKLKMRNQDKTDRLLEEILIPQCGAINCKGDIFALIRSQNALLHIQLWVYGEWC